MKLLDRTRRVMRERGYAARTVQLYVRWLVQYIHYHDLEYPATLDASHVRRFLEYLAVDKNVSATTQNQALDAIRFLYRRVLDAGIDRELATMRAKVPQRLPEATSRDEVEAVLVRLSGRDYLMACLVYGAGLSVSECATLRTYNIDFAASAIILKDRSAPLPLRVQGELQQQVVAANHAPGNVDSYLFPSGRLHEGRCWHVSPSSLQKALRRVSDGRITSKMLRQGFVRDLLVAGYDERTVQDVAGYADVRSVLVHKDALRLRGVVSPIDEV